MTERGRRPLRQATEARLHPRLLLLGPMLGGHAGWVPSQSEVIAPLLKSDGFDVAWSSARIGRLSRLVDLLATVTRSARRTDVAVLQVFGGLSLVGEDLVSLCCRALRVPLVLVLHGGDMPRFMTRYPRWSRRVVGRASVLVTPSSFLAVAIQQHGFAARVVPNSIDLAKYPFRLRGPVAPNLFWMRTFHRIYNPGLALRVLARLVPQVPDVGLTMAGQEKGEGEAIRTMARELGVAERVRFVGFLDAEGKSLEAARADIFLNTNHIDNMPVSVVEACAFGLPIVATNVGGIPYLLEHETTGLLCPDDDADMMAAGVLRLLREPTLARRLSEKGRLLAESCAWEVVRPQWEQVFREAVG